MDDDFVDVFRGGVGDSPVKTAAALEPHLNAGSSWPRPSISLSIPGLDTGGAAAAVSPGIPGSRGVATPSPAKESMLRSARSVSGAREEDDVFESPTPSPHLPNSRIGMAPCLTIDPGGECVPTELEKKRAKLEKYKYECSEVVDSFLFVSGEDAAKQQGLVCSKGVTHIINCAGPQCPNYLEYTGRFSFLRLNFYDHRTEDVAWFMYSAFDYIKAAKAQRGRVLVHCVQGVSRSCTLAIAWLMLTEGVDYDEAYLRVRGGRPICAPNTGFTCSLLEWERRRQAPPVTPLLYRTAWHVPLFPNDLVLKICLHEDDRKQVVPTLAALDPRVCYLIVAPRGSSNPTAASTSASASKRGVETLSSSNGWSLPTGRSARATPVSTPSPAAARAAAAAAAAVIANAKAVAAVAAAKEAKAKAAAAAAEEAVMVAKAVEAGVTVPWTWRESDLGSKLDRENPKAKIRLSLDSNLGRLSSDAPVPLASAGAWREAIPWRETDMEVEATGTDVYIWKGSQSSAQMLELARRGAGWLCEYEGWGVGTNTLVVDEGHEPPELLRHLNRPAKDAREPPIYGDLTAPSPPPTAARLSTGSGFKPCATPSAYGGSRAPMLSPAEPPTLSPAGPSPSPGGVSFSPYGCGVSPAGMPFGCPTISPAGSTVASPATHTLQHDGYNYRRCSMASATEEGDDDGGSLIMGLSTMGEEQPSSLLAAPGASGNAGHARGAGASAMDESPPAARLFELADELGGQGTSGLRWSHLPIFDDQDLLPQCCFLLVTPGEQSFLWVGKDFAETHSKDAENLQRLQSLAEDVARKDARRHSDRTLPDASDVESAVVVSGDGNEPNEWWTAFESGYA